MSSWDMSVNRSILHKAISQKNVSEINTPITDEDNSEA